MTSAEVFLSFDIIMLFILEVATISNVVTHHHVRKISLLTSNGNICIKRTISSSR